MATGDEKVTRALQADRQSQQADRYFSALKQDKAGKEITARDPDKSPKSPTPDYARELKSEYGDRKGLPSYKKGGLVRKTGLAKLHKGERVIPKHKSMSRRAR